MPNIQNEGHSPHAPRLTRRTKAALAGVAILALGGIGGAAVVAQTRPSVTMAPVTPVAIRSLSSEGIVTIRGQVAEIYGNKFVVADGSGRALVDTGRRGEDGNLVTAGEPVLVQGRFARGFVHAAFLVGPDKTVVALAPLDGPRHGPGHGPDGPPPGPDHGPGRGADHGPGAPRDGADRDAPPPPPPPPVAANAANAPATGPTAAAGTR